MSMVEHDGRRVRKTHERVGYPMEVFSKSLTQQQFVAESDINNILKRYRDISVLPNVGGRPMYGDFSNMPSYHEALNTVIEARAMFEALPSHVRARFDNDPGKYVDFVADKANYDEAVELGLIQKEAPAEPAPATPAVAPAGDAGTQ